MRSRENAQNISQHWPGDNECVKTESGVGVRMGGEEFL